MKKIFVLLILYSVSMPALLAQQQYYNWYLTAGSGAMAYYGDLSHTLSSTKINVPVFQASIGRNISPSLALTLQGSYGQISGNDRARDWKGTLRTDNMNFSRGLNFQTTIRNASLLLSYRLNNGVILSKHAAVAPYLYGGIGITDFTVSGDLYGENGQRYYYWDDNTIRHLPQQPANATSAQVTGQDGKFETRLSGLSTEQSYPTQVFTIPAGVGVQFRLSDRFSANLQAGANFTYTGYLDDVKDMYRADYSSPEQAYAANPTGIMRDRRGNGKNDLYFAAFLSVGYHFNFKKKSFTPPVAYTGYKSPGAPLAMESNDAEQPEGELARPQSPNTPTVAAAPETGSAPLKQTTAPQQNLNSNNTPDDQPRQPDRQTVDINLRIMLEDGKMVVDTVSRQLTDTSAINRPTERNETLKKLGNPADLELVAQDTTQIEVPSRKIQVVTKTPPANLQNQAAPNPTLAQEVQRLRSELDSLKMQSNQPTKTAIRQPTTPTTMDQPAGQEPVERIQPQARQTARTQNQPDNSAEIAALREEVALLRQEVNRERSQNTRTPPQQVVVPAQKERTSDTGVTAVVPLNTVRPYDDKAMKQLENELTGIRAQLDELRTQKKIEPDTTIDNKIDSLVNLVSTIQNTQATQTSQNTLNQDEENLKQTQLADSLQRQILRLNQSLKSMEKGLAAGIDTLSMGVPYTALGSTVVYYDVNMAQLKEADKQRLNILGKKLKAQPAVLLLIKGYTDQTGNADYNLMLSRKRAENVKNYFVQKLGVQPEQILINFFGQQKASSAASSAQDRRVELELFLEN